MLPWSRGRVPQLGLRAEAQNWGSTAGISQLRFTAGVQSWASELVFNTGVPQLGFNTGVTQVGFRAKVHGWGSWLGL